MDSVSTNATRGHQRNRPDGFEPDDTPPAASSAALVIRAPKGPGAMPLKPGYTVYAVEIDGDDDVIAGQPLTDRLASVSRARVICAGYALTPIGLGINATHVVVNDHTGNEIFRAPIRRAA